jgi:SAM-dependent methyltransferase
MDYKQQADEGIHQKAAELLLPSLTERSTVLVVGAGQGAFEARLMRQGIPQGCLQAADIEPHRYRTSGIECRYADLNEAIPAPDQHCDAVVALEVIEHLDNPRRLITEAHRVLKPKGVLMLSTPNPSSLVQRARYLATGRFDYFSDEDFRGSGHLHPIFPWLLERWWRPLFTPEAFDSSSFHLRIPGLFHIPMPRTALFCPNLIYRLRKQ